MTKDLLTIARECGARHYIHEKSPGIDHCEFTAEQLEAFAARVRGVPDDWREQLSLLPERLNADADMHDSAGNNSMAEDRRARAYEVEQMLATPPAPGAQSERVAEPVTQPDARTVSAMARVLSDRNADACNVDREDQWKIYASDFIADVVAMFAAQPAPEHARGGAEKVCEWVRHPLGGYDSTCGKRLCSMQAGALCQYCGAKIVEVKPS